MVEELKIYKDASEFIKRVFIIVKQFPRDYKFTIGTRIQNTALDCIDLIYKASRHKNKKISVVIQKVNDYLETLNMKLNPCKTKHNKLEYGVNFCGYIIKPFSIYIRNSTK
jgi:hypothetical protein